MASENETVADIVKRVRRDCNSYPLPNAAAEMLKLLREIEAAHRREVAELKKAYDRAVSADARHAIENESLLHCLKVAEDALADMLEIVENVSEYIGVDCATMAKVEKARAALAAIREEGGAR